MKQKTLDQASEVIKKFLGYMQTIKGKSLKTVEEYFVDLRTFFRFMKRHKGVVNFRVPLEEINVSDVDIEFIKTITLTDIYEYMNYVADCRENKPASRLRKTCSLRSFFKFLVNKSKDLEVNPAEELESPKIPKTLPKHLDLEQSKILLNTILKYGGNYAIRDYCIVTLFLNCGLRLSELVGINYMDIGEETLKIRGKGSKERLIYLNPACKEALKNYKKVRKNSPTEKKALFISRQNNRISDKTVQLLIKKYFEFANLGGLGLSVHKLRHTAATLMYQHGNVDIRVLKDILGHENLGTTQIYTHTSSKQIKEAVNSNPLAKIS